MKIKPGVRLNGLRVEMMVALMIIEPILKRYQQELVITSALDSKHSNRSRHYVGHGLDVRTRDIVGDVNEVVDKIKADLGSEYYVAFEKNHIHISFNGSVTP